MRIINNTFIVCNPLSSTLHVTYSFKNSWREVYEPVILQCMNRFNAGGVYSLGTTSSVCASVYGSKTSTSNRRYEQTNSLVTDLLFECAKPSEMHYVDGLASVSRYRSCQEVLMHASHQLPQATTKGLMIHSWLSTVSASFANCMS